VNEKVAGQSMRETRSFHGWFHEFHRSKRNRQPEHQYVSTKHLAETQPFTITRRQFLGTTATALTAAAAFPSIIPSSALGKDGAVAPRAVQQKP